MKKVIKTPKKVEKVVEVVTEEVTDIVESDGGPTTLLDTDVYVCCSSYAYSGKLVGVNDKFIELEDVSIVYETGAWTNKNWSDAQKLPCKKIVIFQAQIESMFTVVR